MPITDKYFYLTSFSKKTASKKTNGELIYQANPIPVIPGYYEKFSRQEYGKGLHIE